MKLTTKARYAVTAILEMASRTFDTPTTLAEISEQQNIPVNYLEQIFARLKRANLVKAIKGPKGGYIISTKLSDIKIINIIDAVDENTEMTRCSKESKIGCMLNKAQCNTHNLWFGLTEHIRDYLNNISIEDILLSNNEK